MFNLQFNFFLLDQSNKSLLGSVSQYVLSWIRTIKQISTTGIVALWNLKLDNLFPKAWDRIIKIEIIPYNLKNVIIIINLVL